MTLERALYELLKTQANGRVYAMRAPQSEVNPFVIFQRTDSSRVRSINKPSGLAQAYIQIDAYAESYYTSKELARTIELLLDGYRGTVYYGDADPQDFVKIGGISLQNDQDLFDQTDEPFLFRNSATYLVTYHQ